MWRCYCGWIVVLCLLAPSGGLLAQEDLSPFLAVPWNSRLGGQLIYFYEDGNSVGGQNSGSRGSWRSSLTLTNVHPSAKVKIHFQFYSPALSVVLQFSDFVQPGRRVILDPQDLRRPSDNAYVGRATDGIYLLTATPVNQEYPSSPKAIPFNWLTGEASVRCLTNGHSLVYNAVSRMAVFSDGTPIHPAYSGVAGAEGVLFYLDGTSRLFQQFRPKKLLLTNYFPSASLTPGVPFGNRLTFLSFQDTYTDPGYPMVLQAPNLSVTTFVFDGLENALSASPRSCSGLKEYTFFPNPANAAGNFPDFVSYSFHDHIRTGGWLWISAPTLPAGCSLLGWFFQAKNGTTGGVDLLPAFKN